jgi:hypothetical protein
MYDKFLEDQKAAFFVLDDRITSQIDEIFLVDNNSADPTPHIVATGMKDEDGNFSWDVPTDRDSSLVDTDGMFYGLTIHSAKYGTPNISRGTPEDIRAITEKAHREWVEFDKAETAEKETTTKAASASASASAAGQGGYSRKRRLHINRPRKTMKKYTRRVTRRRGHGHGRGRRSQRR